MASLPIKSRRRIRVSNLFVLVGPSGSGKTTAINALLAKYPGDLFFPLTYTTRLARQGESNGRDFYFVSPEVWESMNQEGAFLASTTYANQRYGTTAADILSALEKGKKVICAFDLSGLRDALAAGLGPISIFLAPESKEQLAFNLAKRWPNEPERINERLQFYDQELVASNLCDYVVQSTTIPEIVERLEALIFPQVLCHSMPSI